MYHLLPAAALTWKFRPEMQARLGYSLTVTRPDFKELSTAAYWDDLRNVEVVGNHQLIPVQIHHLDLRGEWYPSSQTHLSLGTFVKFLQNPIESIKERVAADQQRQTFENAKLAKLYGLEVEFQQHFAFLHRKLADLSLGGNGALTASQVELALAGKTRSRTSLTSKKRALQGLSPFTFNLTLSYQNPDIGHTSSLLYHVVGSRIVDLGTDGMPDEYERPTHGLDYVLSQKLHANLDLGIKAKNLLGGKRQTMQDDKVILEQPWAREISVSLKGHF
jgi:outer membrane receptor protein involved in Fe transport